MATDSVLLCVRGLHVGDGSNRILTDVSFDVKEGEIVSILGPNQAGKTTLLLCVMGLLRPKEGRITFDGTFVNNLKPSDLVRSGVVLVPERRELFGSMSVKENLEIGALYTKSRRDRDNRFERVAELFPILKERLKQRAETLSGGEQQMLSIGRALMSAPRLLMLDEPQLGLAPKIMDKLAQALQSLSEQGITILMAEQMGQEMRLASKRKIIFAKGRITGS